MRTVALVGEFWSEMLESGMPPRLRMSVAVADIPSGSDLRSQRVCAEIGNEHAAIGYIVFKMVGIIRGQAVFEAEGVLSVAEQGRLPKSSWLVSKAPLPAVS